MTPNQIESVRQSLPAILAARNDAPDRFDDQFVSLGPEPPRLFARADVHGQAPLLINAIANAVESLLTGDDGRAAHALDQDHLCFGVEPDHFRDAGAALVRTLEQELGSRFTAELADAWASASEWVGRRFLGTSHPFAA
jgi:nitric oxide dioxygenase